MSKKCNYFFVGWTKEKNYGIYSDLYDWGDVQNKRIVYWDKNRITKERNWKTLLGFLIVS
jgi:hypothetical protein